MLSFWQTRKPFPDFFCTGSDGMAHRPKVCVISATMAPLCCNVKTAIGNIQGRECGWLFQETLTVETENLNFIHCSHVMK